MSIHIGRQVAQMFDHALLIQRQTMGATPRVEDMQLNTVPRIVRAMAELKLFLRDVTQLYGSTRREMVLMADMLGNRHTQGELERMEVYYSARNEWSNLRGYIRTLERGTNLERSEQRDFISQTAFQDPVQMEYRYPIGMLSHNSPADESIEMTPMEVLQTGDINGGPNYFRQIETQWRQGYGYVGAVRGRYLPWTDRVPFLMPGNRSGRRRRRGGEDPNTRGGGRPRTTYRFYGPG
jgi:hypothetical protein